MTHRSIECKINRLFYVLTNPRMCVLIIILNVFFAISFIFSNDRPIVNLSILVTVNVIFISDLLVHSPNKLLIFDNTVEFSQYITLRSYYGRFFVVTKKQFPWLKVNYTVSDIQTVVFHQNPIEKMFNIGHVSFNGRATFTAKRDLERIPDKNKFSIYGITNFSDFKENFIFEKESSI